MNSHDRQLFELCFSGVELERVESLLANGANVNATNNEDCNCTALLYAVRNPNPNFGLIEWLLRKGAYIEAENDNDGCTALHYAVRNPNISYQVIELLVRSRANVNAVNFSDGLCTPLLYVAQNPNINYQVMELLLRNGANVNAQNMSDGECSALMYAFRNFNLEVIELLLRNGANANVKNGNFTTLMYAIRKANFNLIELLFKNGAKVHTLNSDLHHTDTALLYAVRKLNIDPELVELILKYAKVEHASFGKLCTGCLKALKYIVLEQVKKNPLCICNIYNCKSVLSEKYFNLFLPHFSSEAIKIYVGNCVLEIERMKEDKIYPLLFPSPVVELSFFETARLVDQLHFIWNTSSLCYPLYFKVIKSMINIKDLHDLLGRFCIYSRSSVEQVQRVAFLDWASTMSVLQFINLEDMLNVATAFFSFPSPSCFMESLGHYSEEKMW